MEKVYFVKCVLYVPEPGWPDIKKRHVCGFFFTVPASCDKKTIEDAIKDAVYDNVGHPIGYSILDVKPM